MKVQTFMVSQDMEDGNVAEDFSEQIEDTIHDGSVTIESRLPNAVINDVTSMIDNVSVRVRSSHTAKRVFNCSPGRVTVSIITPETFLSKKCLAISLKFSFVKITSSICRV